MTDLLKMILPSDLIPVIKEYTGEIKVRNGKPMRQLHQNDRRYAMLKNRPQIRQLRCGNEYEKPRGCAWFKTSDKKTHIVLTVYYNYSIPSRGMVWEMNILGKERITIYI